MDATVGAAVLVCAAGGLIAGMIGFQRVGGVGAFIGYGFVGALLPLIGIVVACTAKAPPRPPGWYPDPWGQAAARWFDGTDWTWHLLNAESHPTPGVSEVGQLP